MRRGTVGDIAAYYESSPPRGEVVIVVGGGRPAEGASEDTLRERASALLSAGSSVRDVAARLTAELGASRNVAYRIAREAQERGTGSEERG